MIIWEVLGGSGGFSGFYYFASKKKARAHIKELIKGGVPAKDISLDFIEVTPTREGIARSLNDLACDCEVGGTEGQIYYEALGVGEYGR